MYFLYIQTLSYILNLEFGILNLSEASDRDLNKKGIIAIDLQEWAP